MDIRFEEQNDGRFRIVDEERRLGVVIPQDDGSYGYSLFNTPHMGREESLDAVRKAVKKRLR